MYETSVETLYKEVKTNGLMNAIVEKFGGGAKIEIGYTQAVCDTPVELLDLSVRSYNALMRANCKTVGQAITAINQQSLQGMRNLGRKSIAEIRSLIVEYGYKQLSETRKREFLLNLLQVNGNKEE